jgi:hypothetical protein
MDSEIPHDAPGPCDLIALGDVTAHGQLATLLKPTCIAVRPYSCICSVGP